MRTSCAGVYHQEEAKHIWECEHSPMHRGGWGIEISDFVITEQREAPGKTHRCRRMYNTWGGALVKEKGLKEVDIPFTF